MPLRVGLIIPSSNRMVEQEMIRHFPADVAVHVNRLRMTGPNRKPMADLLPQVEAACAALMDAKCDVVVFHCTANSMSDGLDGEAALLAALDRAGAPHAATTSTAIKGALDALGARNISLVTPYSAHVTQEESDFLEASGYRVVQQKGWALPGSDAYCSTPPAYWLERMELARHDSADAYFLSCSNVQGMGVIKESERLLARPVITSNQAVIWDALRHMGWRGNDTMPGRLFQAAQLASGAR